MKKYLFGLLVLLFGFSLVACGGKEVSHEVKFYVGEELHYTATVKSGDKIKKEDVENPTIEGETFKFWADNGKEFSFDTEIKKDYELHAQFSTLEDIIKSSFENNNYQNNTKIYYYDELEEEAILKYDGDKSSYQDSNVHEIYVEKNGVIEVYLEQGNGWKKLQDQTLKDGYDIFSYFKNDAFNKDGQSYELKNENLDLLNEYFTLELQTEFKLLSLEITVNNGKITGLNYVIEIERDNFMHKHTVDMAFSNFGDISLTVPTV